jgi:hypothetical protein
VTNLRRTNLPVGITVANGGHAWILTGFTATADPLTTSKFTVTSVRVVGPLFGLQSRHGYDMPPDTKLTAAQFQHFFTPWKYAPKPMIWDGRYVSIQPIPAKKDSTAPGAPAVSPRPTGTSIAPSPSALLSGSVGASAEPSSSAAAEVALIDPSQTAATGLTAAPTGSDGPGPGLGLAFLAIALAIGVMAVGIGRTVGRSKVGGRRRPVIRPRRPTYRPRS